MTRPHGPLPLSPLSTALVVLLTACTAEQATPPEKATPAEKTTPADDSSEAALKDRCERGVGHTTGLVLNFPPGTTISPREAAVMDAAKDLSIASCVEEGLSQAQLTCILAVQDAMRLSELAHCPAIAEHKPSWLILPPAQPEHAPPPT